MSHRSLDVINACFSSDADDLVGSPWWSGRGDFSQPGLGGAPRAGPGDEELSDVSSGGADGSGTCGGGRRVRAAQFTEYSITSSVVPRSEGICTHNMCNCTFWTNLTT